MEMFYIILGIGLFTIYYSFYDWLKKGLAEMNKPNYIHYLNESADRNYIYYDAQLNMIWFSSQRRDQLPSRYDTYIGEL